ncbi:MAG TPA: FAD/NAD(P)-binding oxidoreductase [Methylomirabilota bacterium]|nr:FAD/NAD(P)-binding oxidoreductase [Methylomirabilota bacterium]
MGGTLAVAAVRAPRAAAGPAPRTPARLLADPGGQRLVVLGAGFGGLTAALTVKRLRPRAEVVVLERAAGFVSAPGSLEYLFGLAPVTAITRGYATLAGRGLRLIQAPVQAVDLESKRVVTPAGVLGYDYLLVATGLRLAWEEVPGLADGHTRTLSFFEPGPALVDARRRIEAFTGGHVVVTTPASAYKCPPAPYEYALLWADALRRRRLPGRVTLVDPRPKPTPPALAPGILAAMDAHRGRLTYEPFARLLSVDLESRAVETEAGRLSFDVLSVVPPNAPMAFLAEAGLGEPFVDVDPRTFRSTRDPAVYAVGDTADTPYARTAATAISSARIAGRHIAETLGAAPRDAGAPSNVCFPLVSAERALLLRTQWSHAGGAGETLHVEAESTADNEASAAHLRSRRQWAAAALRAMFGG